MKDVSSQARREWLAIAAITAGGAIVRFWAFNRITLSHFDEGIYAFSGLWIVSKHGMLGLDPDVIPYAPPLFQILVGLAYLVAGVRDVAAIAVATICGVATIPVLGWIGRRTFGPGAGAVAAVFGALSLPHIAFSRKALTDAPFLLAWLVAIVLGTRFLEKPGAVRALVLGLAIGIAQNVKYNGWLVGVIVLIAAAVDVLARTEARPRRPVLRLAGWLLAAAVIAGVSYAPWYCFVEAYNDGGYAALLQHHRSYMSGFSAWLSNWQTQMAEAAALAGPYPWRAATWALALLGPACLERPGLSPRAWFAIGLPSLVGLAAILAIPQNLAWWLAACLSPWLLLAPQPGWRMLGAWWFLMSVLTPFYHPYARLWMPLHALGWVVLSGVIVTCANPQNAVAGKWLPGKPGSPVVTIVSIIVVGGCLALAFWQGLTAPRPFSLRRFLQPDATASFREFARRLAETQQREPGANFEVWARRPLAFYLAEQESIRFQGAPDLDTLLLRARPGVWAVIDEVVELQKGGHGETVTRTKGLWNPAWTFASEADPVTLLDIDPQEPCGPEPRQSFQIRVLSPRESSYQGPP